MASTLVLGSSGEEVTRLQAVLNYHRRGAADPLLRVDGIFGPLTQQRVRGFQSTNLLAVDGIVGPNTAAALMTICRTTAEYVVEKDIERWEIGGGRANQPGTTVTREYELMDGISVTLDPWDGPPAKPKYVLEFETSWVIKNPRLPVPLVLSIGAEVGRLLVTPAPDAPYIYSGAGKVAAKFEKDFTLGPLTLDSAVQAQFEAEHEVPSPDVRVSAQLSLVSGISFAVLRDRFYFFTQGELGAALKWSEGKIQPTAQWEGSAGFKLTF
jgi:Putative peptidoglycan binding domain